jgi:hypothetical protein
MQLLLLLPCCQLMCVFFCLHLPLIIILQVIVTDADDEEALYRQDDRWRFALSAATWPELLRRYILTRLFCQDCPLASVSVARAADALAEKPLVRMPPRDKARLLALACDEAADTTRLRSELRDRMDRVEQVQASPCQLRPHLLICLT